MNQKTLSRWLKVIIVGMAICGGIIYLYLLPFWAKDLVTVYPEYTYCYWPWLIVLWISAVPCYLVLYYGWKITVEIEKDNSFSLINANYLKNISVLAAINSVYFFTANLVFMLLNMNHPGIFAASLILVFTGAAITVSAAALSHLVQNAAILKEENELTI